MDIYDGLPAGGFTHAHGLAKLMASGTLLFSGIFTADGNTNLNVNRDQHGIDLQPGYFVFATDLTSNQTTDLTLMSLTFDLVDYEADTASGTAAPGARVIVHANRPFEHYEVVVFVDGDGNWLADFGAQGVDLTEEMWLNVEIRDLEGDQTTANAPRPPVFTASLDTNNVWGNDWSPNSDMQIEVYEAEGGALVAGPFTFHTDDYGNFGVDLLPYGVDLQPGQYLRLTDLTSGHIKDTTLIPLTFTSVDFDQDIAYGTAPADTRLRIGIGNQFSWNEFDFFSESDGQWAADFGAHFVDLLRGMSGNARFFDADGDATQAEWSSLNSRLEVLAYADRLAIVDWPAGQTVHITIDDPATVQSPDYEESFTPDGSSNYYEIFTLYDLKPGDLITASNGDLTKTLEIAVLEAVTVDRFAGTVNGIAAPGTRFDMQVTADHFLWPINDVVYTDSSGLWSVDYSDMSGPLPWTWATIGRMQQWDEDGDLTMAYWHVHWPVLEVWLNSAELWAFDWELGSTLTFTVDDPATYEPVDFTAQAETSPQTWIDHGAASVFVGSEFELRPGMVVTITDGTITKSTIIQPLQIEAINAANDTLSGLTSAEALLDIALHKDWYLSHRYFTADADGNWLLDYGVPDAAGRTFDLTPGDQFRLFVRDDDFDSTVLEARVTNPSFSARLTENEVHGYDWLLNSEVTVTIDDPTAVESPDYTDTQTAIVAPRDSSQTFVQFRLWEAAFDLEPGQTVTMTDGVVTKTHTVTSLTVTEVDPANDTVRGTTDPGALVEVGHMYCNETGCHALRRVTADASGNWLADFSVPGLEGDERDRETFDIRGGTGSEARQPDEDGDTTNVQWRVPYIEASPASHWLHGRDWPLGTELTATVDNPSEDPFTLTATVIHNPDNPGDPNDIGAFFDLEGHEIETGAIIAMGATGETPRELAVSQLAVTAFNPDEDTISGIGTPGAEIEVCGNMPNKCISRRVTADGSGNWMADYQDGGDYFDVQLGSNGWAAEYDADGDKTWFDWRITIPVIAARPYEWQVSGYDWALGTLVTMTIDDPATPASVDYTDTVKVIMQPWGTPKRGSTCAAASRCNPAISSR